MEGIIIVIVLLTNLTKATGQVATWNPAMETRSLEYPGVNTQQEPTMVQSIERSAGSGSNARQIQNSGLNRLATDSEIVAAAVMAIKELLPGFGSAAGQTQESKLNSGSRVGTAGNTLVRNYLWNGKSVNIDIQDISGINQPVSTRGIGIDTSKRSAMKLLVPDRGIGVDISRKQEFHPQIHKSKANINQAQVSDINPQLHDSRIVIHPVVEQAMSPTIPNGKPGLAAAAEINLSSRNRGRDSYMSLELKPKATGDKIIETLMEKGIIGKPCESPLKGTSDNVVTCDLSSPCGPHCYSCKMLVGLRKPTGVCCPMSASRCAQRTYAAMTQELSAGYQGNKGMRQLSRPNKRRYSNSVIAEQFQGSSPLLHVKYSSASSNVGMLEPPYGPIYRLNTRNSIASASEAGSQSRSTAQFTASQASRDIQTISDIKQGAMTASASTLIPSESPRSLSETIRRSHMQSFLRSKGLSGPVPSTLQEKRDPSKSITIEPTSLDTIRQNKRQRQEQVGLKFAIPLSWRREAQSHLNSGIREQHKISGISEQPNLPGTNEQHNLPGISEQHKIPGISEQRNIPRISGQPNLPGTSEQHSLPRISEQYNLQSRLQSTAMTTESRNPVIRSINPRLGRSKFPSNIHSRSLSFPANTPADTPKSTVLSNSRTRNTKPVKRVFKPSGFPTKARSRVTRENVKPNVISLPRRQMIESRRVAYKTRPISLRSSYTESAGSGLEPVRLAKAGFQSPGLRRRARKQRVIGTRRHGSSISETPSFRPHFNLPRFPFQTRRLSYPNPNLKRFRSQTSRRRSSKFSPNSPVPFQSPRRRFSARKPHLDSLQL